MMSVAADIWADVWAADIWADIWANIVQAEPAPTISGIRLYSLLDGRPAILNDLAGTTALYPVLSGEFTA